MALPLPCPHDYFAHYFAAASGLQLLTWVTSFSCATLTVFHLCFFCSVCHVSFVVLLVPCMTCSSCASLAVSDVLTESSKCSYRKFEISNRSDSIKMGV